MAIKNPSSGRLAEIVASRRSQGSSVTGALAGGIKERLKEKFDPRQLINQKGLLAALFPGLKTYQAKTAATEISKTSLQSGSLNEIKPILEIISFNTKLTAKNTMVLPALHRDVNVIRQNMVKLVKMKGGDARTKADMFFTKAKEREDKYERELKKERGRRGGLSKLEDEKKENEGFFKKILSAITGGLGTIVKGIVGLGKVIIGTFKLMGEIIFSILSTITNFLFDGLFGIVGLLKSLNIKDLFKSFFSKNFIRFIFGVVFRGIFSFLFSATGLKALIGRLIIPLAAALLGAEGLRAFLQRRSQEGEITLEKEKELFAGDDMGGKQRFPESNVYGKDFEAYKNLGLVDEKVGALAGIQGKSAGGYRESKNQNEKYTAQQQFDKNILYEYEEGKRNSYTLKVPGISTRHSLFLTDKEATDWGDNRRKYLAIIDKLIKVKEGKSNVTEDQLTSLYEAYSSSRDSLLNLYEKYVKENYKTGTDLSVISNNIKAARKREQEDFSDILGRNLTEDYLDPLFENAFPKEMPKFMRDAANTGISFAGNMLDSASNIISETGNSAKNAILQSNSDMKEKFSSQLNQLTQDNKQNSRQTTSEPIIIQNNFADKKQSTVTDRKPASAYDQNFMNWMQNFQYDGIIPNSP